MILTLAGWTGASIVFTHTSGAATYTVSADVLNAYDVAVDLRAWLANASRPWAAAITGVALAVEDDTKRRRFRYTYTGPGTLTFVSIVPNATWISRFGDTSLATPGTCAASCAATPGSLPWERWDNEPGERGRQGAWRPGHPQLAHRRPDVELFLTLEQAYALTQAIRLASQPRTAYIYDEGAAVWRFVTLGKLDLKHPADDYRRVIGTLDVLGGV